MVSPQLLPVMLASDRFAVVGEVEPLDRIRMQKGIFLLAKRGPQEWRDIYAYRPYDWGPYSQDLATDLNALVEAGLLEYEHIPGRRYGRYWTTATGEERLSDIQIEPRLDRFVRSVRRFVTTRSFSKLLSDVYAAFPAYASRSLFQG